MYGEKRIVLLTRSEILKVKTRALRRGIWFKMLSRTERACVDLTTIVVKRVRSHLLQRILGSIVKKLEEIMESRVQRLMREVGVSMVKKVSSIAQGWGLKSACNWVSDCGFIQYLVITEMNLTRCVV